MWRVHNSLPRQTPLYTKTNKKKNQGKTVLHKESLYLTWIYCKLELVSRVRRLWWTDVNSDSSVPSKPVWGLWETKVYIHKDSLLDNPALFMLIVHSYCLCINIMPIFILIFCLVTDWVTCGVFLFLFIFHVLQSDWSFFQWQQRLSRLWPATSHYKLMVRTNTSCPDRPAQPAVPPASKTTK